MSAAIDQVAVIGAGTMGNGIAQAFAAAGYPVTIRVLNSEYLDRGMPAIVSSLDRLASRGRITPDERDATLARIRLTTELAHIGDSDLVVEAVSEDYDLKARLIRELDEIC